MKSIMQNDDYCYLCGGNGGYWGLDWHHVFGASNRSKSEKYGLKVKLCHESCHLYGVHKKADLSAKLKREAQIKAMDYYGWSVDDFIREFGENYI